MKIMKLTTFGVLIRIAFIAAFLIFVLCRCSVERKITKECEIAATFIDINEGTVIVCVKCDSIKSSLIKRIEKKYKK